MAIDGLRPDIQSLHALGNDAEALERARTSREAAQQFETYMARILVREMRKTVPEGLFSGPAMDMFSDLFDEELAERISNGGSLGLADALLRGMPGGEDLIAAAAPRAPRGYRGGEELGALAAWRARRGGGGRREGILPLLGRLTSGFGLRVDPLGDGHKHHKGLDIAAPKGSSIGAVEGGVVTFAGWRGNYGNAVIIRHTDGTESLYGHCEALRVQEGQQVRPGQTIATVGSTGRSTGPHLHFELRENGEQVDPLRAYGWERSEELQR